MLELGLLVAGVLLGGALGWAVARVNGEAALRGAREGLHGRLAAAESRADEKAQLDTEVTRNRYVDHRRMLDIERA